jgi:hypothetical protein
MKKSHKCYHCGYYKKGYCNDLDERVNPDYPECSEEYYNS